HAAAAEHSREHVAIRQSRLQHIWYFTHADKVPRASRASQLTTGTTGPTAQRDVRGRGRTPRDADLLMGLGGAFK
ncbi:hypothetical protein ACFL3B_05490, partial [Gemmatimonadota bacterium]